MYNFNDYGNFGGITPEFLARMQAQAAEKYEQSQQNFDPQVPLPPQDDPSLYSDPNLGGNPPMVQEPVKAPPAGIDFSSGETTIPVGVPGSSGMGGIDYSSGETTIPAGITFGEKVADYAPLPTVPDPVTGVIGTLPAGQTGETPPEQYSDPYMGGNSRERGETDENGEPVSISPLPPTSPNDSGPPARS